MDSTTTTSFQREEEEDETEDGEEEREEGDGCGRGKYVWVKQKRGKAGYLYFPGIGQLGLYFWKVNVRTSQREGLDPDIPGLLCRIRLDSILCRESLVCHCYYTHALGMCV